MSYPKKLYFGTLKNRKMKTVLNDYDEQQLRSQGWVDFAQLGKGNDGSQSTEQPSAECEELKNKWSDVSALTARLQELNQQQSPPSNENYETWTVKQLRDELEKYGITPSQDTRKADLIDLLKQKQGAEGVA